MQIFDGQIALVTGASALNGIGSAICQELSSKGATVIIGGRHTENMEKVKQRLIDEGGKAEILPIDVTNLTEIKEKINWINKRFGKIDILVNNAGIASPTQFLDISLEEYENIFNVNMKGTFFLTQEVLPIMFENKYGRIINIGSVSGKKGGGKFAGTHYCASKAAMHGFTKALALEVAPYGITVNAVVPGLIETPITDSVLEDSDLREKMTENIPVKRVGMGKDIALAVSYLAAKDAGYITGAEIDVNGGSYIC